MLGQINGRMMARRPSRQPLASRSTGLTVHKIWKKSFLHSQSHCVPYTDKSRSTEGLACVWHSKFRCCQRERWGPPKLNGIVPTHKTLDFQNTGPMWAQLRSGHSTRVRRARVIMKKKKRFWVLPRLNMPEELLGPSHPYLHGSVLVPVLTDHLNLRPLRSH